MPRRRFYTGGVPSDGGMPPSGDPLAAQRLNLAEQRFAQTTQTQNDRLSLAQQSSLLQKEEMLFQLIKARQAIELKREQTVQAANIISQMGGLDFNDPKYQQKRANILANNAVGLSAAQPWVNQLDSVWEAHQ